MWSADESVAASWPAGGAAGGWAGDPAASPSSSILSNGSARYQDDDVSGTDRIDIRYHDPPAPSTFSRPRAPPPVRSPPRALPSSSFVHPSAFTAQHWSLPPPAPPRLPAGASLPSPAYPPSLPRARARPRNAQGPQRTAGSFSPASSRSPSPLLPSSSPSSSSSRSSSPAAPAQPSSSSFPSSATSFPSTSSAASQAPALLSLSSSSSSPSSSLQQWWPSLWSSASRYSYQPLPLDAAAAEAEEAAGGGAEGGAEVAADSFHAQQPPESGSSEEADGIEDEDEASLTGDSDDCLSSSDEEAVLVDATQQRRSHSRRVGRRLRRQTRNRPLTAAALAALEAVAVSLSACYHDDLQPAVSRIGRQLQLLSVRCLRLLLSPDRWLQSLLSFALVKQSVQAYKELPWSHREKLLFFLCSTLGTVLFFFLFESFMIVTTLDMEAADEAFTVSYLLSYVISLAWQHALHRLLVFSHQPYCLSLLQTYLSYSLSLACMAAIGFLLIQQLQLPPRLVAAITLPCSAIGNYYLLHCISAAVTLPALNTGTETWTDWRQQRQQQQQELSAAGADALLLPSSSSSSPRFLSGAPPSPSAAPMLSVAVTSSAAAQPQQQTAAMSSSSGSSAYLSLH